VIDRALPQIAACLRQPSTGASGRGGLAYVILVEDNQPEELAKLAKETYGLSSHIVVRVKAKNEALLVMRFERVCNN
jgi:hypothetical protein